MRGVTRALWQPARSELWVHCEQAGADARVRVFDAWLREQPARAAAEMPPQGVVPESSGALELALWPGRRLQLTEVGELVMLPASWETVPVVHWGKGWASVEMRCARPLEPLLWRHVGDAEIHVVEFHADPCDGARRRAFLRGISAGERLELALPDLQPRFPPRLTPRWEALTAPESGADATSAWPSR